MYPLGKWGFAPSVPLLTATAMSNAALPTELVGFIIDLVCDISESSLRSCCLVSKSWIFPVRCHLFCNVMFGDPEMLQWWTDAFPDPSSSPAHYVRSLTVWCPKAVEGMGPGWISAFRNVTRFTLYIRETNPNVLNFFRGFSSSVLTLNIDADASSTSHVIHLACSFPCLQNLIATVDKLRERPNTLKRLPPSTCRLGGAHTPREAGGVRDKNAKNLLNLIIQWGDWSGARQ